jgi:hypothetical protein
MRHVMDIWWLRHARPTSDTHEGLTGWRLSFTMICSHLGSALLARSSSKPSRLGLSIYRSANRDRSLSLSSHGGVSPAGSPTASTNFEPETTPPDTYLVSLEEATSSLIAAFAPALSPACVAQVVV